MRRAEGKEKHIFQFFGRGERARQRITAARSSEQRFSGVCSLLASKKIKNKKSVRRDLNYFLSFHSKRSRAAFSDICARLSSRPALNCARRGEGKSVVGFSVERILCMPVVRDPRRRKCTEKWGKRKVTTFFSVKSERMLDKFSSLGVQRKLVYGRMIIIFSSFFRLFLRIYRVWWSDISLC